MFVPVESRNTSFKDYTLLMPCVSVGNVSQLTVDLLVSTLALEKEGYLYDDSILPIVGNNPYAPFESKPTCSMVTAVEVYASKEQMIAVIQQRSPCVKGKRKQFVTKLCHWIKDCEFARVVSMASMFAHERRDKQLQGSPMRFFTTPLIENLSPKLQDKGWQPLEKRHELGDATIHSPEGATCVADEYYIPGSGSLYEMCKQCEEKEIALLCVLSFCAEGDNAVDAINMADYLNSHYNWFTNENDSDKSKSPTVSRWKIPSSWQLQYGSRYLQRIY